MNGSTPSYWQQPLVCTTAGLLGNILLAAGKLTFGVVAGSAALVADGIHSLADVLSDIGILFSLKAANRPPDDNHPYGHHSFETLGAIVVAALMVLTAGLIARSAIMHLLAGDLLTPEWPALAATLVSVVVKELMARYTISVARTCNSPALLANGAMHRSDAISSLAAAAGISGAMLGWPVLDNAGALVISVFILKMGFDLLRENVMALMDTMPDQSLVTKINEAAENVADVQTVRSLHIRQRGSKYLVDIRIAVHPEHTIAAAHDIAHATEDEIRRRVADVAHVFVHVEPGSGVTSVTNDPPVPR